MDILVTVLLFVPFIFILWLANLSYGKQVAGEAQSAHVLRWLSYGLLIAIYLGFIFLGLVLQLVGLLTGGTDASLPPAGVLAGPERMSALALSLWLPALLGLALLARPVRRLFARFTPLDPDSPVQAVALSYSALVVLNLVATLGMGLDNLAQMMEDSAAAGTRYDLIPGIWAQDIALVFLGLVGVGWLARRGLGSALQRLGIVRPTWAQLGIGIGVGLLMVPVVLAAESLLARIGLQVDSSVERLSEQLIGPLATSIPGILTLGLAAALGEETIFRGALQPRFGLILTTVLFALLHSQYGLSVATLIVFGVGLALGLLRLRYNTSTSMAAHAVYNMTLGLLTLLGITQKL